MAVEILQHEAGWILPVKAQPGAGRNQILGEQQGLLKVAVTQTPEKGKANQAVIEVLAKGLGLKRSQIDLMSGETSRQKTFLIRGVSLAELERSVAAYCQKA